MMVLPAHGLWKGTALLFETCPVLVCPPRGPFSVLYRGIMTCQEGSSPPHCLAGLLCLAFYLFFCVGQPSGALRH